MTKRWLRGVLLGVSLSLLLAGGVALANGAFVLVSTPCFECDPIKTDPHEDKYIPELEFGGWSQSSDTVCVGISNPATGPWWDECGPPGDTEEPCDTSFVVYCDGTSMGGSSCFDIPPDQAQEVGPAVPNGVESMYGEWVGWVVEWDGGEVIGHAEATFLFSDDCAAAMFVPEPGTMALLGTGVMGLAGYAALRWRTRE